MSDITIILIALGLAMDAFAVAVCIGLATEKFTAKKTLIAGGVILIIIGIKILLTG
ncbi:MAG: hypothetical protein LBN12_03755 [Clostridiales Family XIII bacterium]|jgi:putative Mn2+ efflux pump MntP|nr:hypothetical protein [Clostridiales Family XIII bacterium]